MGDASEVSPSAPSPVTEVLSAHVKDAQNTPIVPLKSDAVSKDQAQGNGDSDFKAPDFIAPDSKVVSQVSKKGKSSSKKNLGPENKPTEQEKVDRNPKKEQEESSDHKKMLLEEDLIEVDVELCNAETCTFEELNLSDYDS